MTKTKTKTATPEDQAPAVETTAAAPIPAPEAPPVDPGADEAAEAAAAAAAAEAAAPAEPIDPKRLEDLNHLAQTIHMLNTTGHRMGLVDELTNLWGAEIVESDGDGVTVAMLGITTDPADCVETALTNWSNAARRAIAAAA